MRQLDKRRVAALLEQQAAEAVPAGVDLRPALHAQLGLPARRGTGARRLALALPALLLLALGAWLLVPGVRQTVSQVVSPAPATFHATLTFTPPLSVDAFVSFVHETGVLPTQNRLQGTDAQGLTVSLGAPGQWALDANGRELEGTPRLGGDGIDREHLQMFLGDKVITGLVVVQSEVILDGAVYARLEHDPRVSLDSGGKEPPGQSADAVVARWKQAADALRTVRGHQEFATVGPDGAPVDPPAGSGLPASSDEVLDLSGNGPARYRVDQRSAAGAVITVWDGSHAYRYYSWLNEVYRPQPQSQGAYWMDDLDDSSMYYFLRPANVGYNLVGPGKIDGRDVIELLVKGGNVGPNGMDGTHVYLDASSYLPLRVTTYTPGSQVGVQRSFVNLRVNEPVSDADFAFTPPAGSVIVDEAAYGAPRLATYGSLEDAARQAGFPLYAPPGMPAGEIYAQYFVEREGVRSAVIALNNGAILEGLYLPLDGANRYPGAVPTPESFAIDGRPATLSLGGTLSFSNGQTQIRINGVASKEEALRQAAALVPVPALSDAATAGVTVTASPTPAAANPPTTAPGVAGPSPTPGAARPEDQGGPPPTEGLPTPPALPSPPVGAAGGADAWRSLAAEVPYQLFTPAAAADVTLVAGPYRADFPLEAGGTDTYPGVGALYRLPGGETLTVVQMAGWPGDKERFGSMERQGAVAAFYYEDATLRRLIFQPASGKRETDIMLRAGAEVRKNDLFALAAEMRSLPYAPATPTPPDPSSAQTYDH